MDKKLISTLQICQERGKDAFIIGRDKFNKELLEELLKTDNTIDIINIEKVDENLALKLGFKYPQDTKRSIDRSAIKHILKRHGEDSKLAKNSHKPVVTIEDISKYLDYIDEADERFITTRKGNKVLISFKQIKEQQYYVIVEQVVLVPFKLSYAKILKHCKITY